jgi:hypothetical protein
VHGFEVLACSFTTGPPPSDEIVDLLLTLLFWRSKLGVGDRRVKKEKSEGKEGKGGKDGTEKKRKGNKDKTKKKKSKNRDIDAEKEVVKEEPLGVNIMPGSSRQDENLTVSTAGTRDRTDGTSGIGEGRVMSPFLPPNSPVRVPSPFPSVLGSTQMPPQMSSSDPQNPGVSTSHTAHTQSPGLASLDAGCESISGEITMTKRQRQLIAGDSYRPPGDRREASEIEKANIPKNISDDFSAASFSIFRNTSEMELNGCGDVPPITKEGKKGGGGGGEIEKGDRNKEKDRKEKEKEKDKLDSGFGPIPTPHSILPSELEPEYRVDDGNVSVGKVASRKRGTIMSLFGWKSAVGSGLTALTVPHGMDNNESYDEENHGSGSGSGGGPGSGSGSGGGQGSGSRSGSGGSGMGSGSPPVMSPILIGLTGVPSSFPPLPPSLPPNTGSAIENANPRLSSLSMSPTTVPTLSSHSTLLSGSASQPISLPSVPLSPSALPLSTFSTDAPAFSESPERKKDAKSEKQENNFTFEVVRSDSKVGGDVQGECDLVDAGIDMRVRLSQDGKSVRSENGIVIANGSDGEGEGVGGEEEEGEEEDEEEEEEEEEEEVEDTYSMMPSTHSKEGKIERICVPQILPVLYACLPYVTSLDVVQATVRAIEKSVTFAPSDDHVVHEDISRTKTSSKTGIFSRSSQVRTCLKSVKNDL